MSGTRGRKATRCFKVDCVAMATKLRDVTRKLCDAESALAREQAQRELLVDGHRRALQAEYDELRRKYDVQALEVRDIKYVNVSWRKYLTAAEAQVVSLTEENAKLAAQVAELRKEVSKHAQAEAKNARAARQQMLQLRRELAERDAGSRKQEAECHRARKQAIQEQEQAQAREQAALEREQRAESCEEQAQQLANEAMEAAREAREEAIAEAAVAEEARATASDAERLCALALRREKYVKEKYEHLKSRLQPYILLVPMP